LCFAGPSLEAQVLEALNRARENPKSLVPYLKKMKPKFEGKYFRLGPGRVLSTQEGWAAVEEAISELKKLPKVGKLEVAKPLVEAARDHLRDQGKSGGLGHTGSDGSDALARLKRHGRPRGKSGESIAYGAYTSKTGMEFVVALLVDDGISNRGHRKCLLDPVYRFVGIACGPHPKASPMCVLDFAEQL
jgi:uncharacterized protein YkwD